MISVGSPEQIGKGWDVSEEQESGEQGGHRWQEGGDGVGESAGQHL